MKGITESTHKEITSLKEFTTEISQAVVNNFKEVVDKFKNVSDQIGTLSSNISTSAQCKDSIAQTRTQLSAMHALLHETLKVSLVTKFIITPLLSIFRTLLLLDPKRE